MKPKQKDRKDKIQVPMRLTLKDHARFRKVMKERHVEFESQMARMIVLEYLDNFLDEKMTQEADRPTMHEVKGSEMPGAQYEETTNMPTGEYFKFLLDRLNKELTNLTVGLCPLETKIKDMDLEYDMQIEFLKNRINLLEKRAVKNKKKDGLFSGIFKKKRKRKTNANT